MSNVYLVTEEGEWSSIKVVSAHATFDGAYAAVQNYEDTYSNEGYDYEILTVTLEE